MLRIVTEFDGESVTRKELLQSRCALERLFLAAEEDTCRRALDPFGSGAGLLHTLVSIDPDVCKRRGESSRDLRRRREASAARSQFVPHPYSFLLARKGTVVRNLEVAHHLRGLREQAFACERSPGRRLLGHVLTPARVPEAARAETRDPSRRVKLLMDAWR